MSFPTAESIEKRIAYLDNLIKRKEALISKATPGRIKARKQGDKYYYEYFSDQGDSRYLRTKDAHDMNIAKAIAQADYDRRIIQSALSESKLLKKAQDFYESGCSEDIYQQIGEARRSLITPIRSSDKEYVKQWLARPRQLSKRLSKEEGFETERGEYVRSKSEVFIANALLKYGIPYIYEPALSVIDHTSGLHRVVYPDFLVLNIRTRSEYYYEHFGKMDDPGYATDNIGKLTDYALTGYHIGEQLITSFETRIQPLKPDAITLIIEHYLL